MKTKSTATSIFYDGNSSLWFQHVSQISKIVYFHKASHGLDDQPVKERDEAASIGRISTLKRNTRSLEEIVEKANRLCDEIHSELVQRGLKFKQVGIMAVMEDISIRSRMRTLDSPTNDLEALKSNVRELFKRFLEESELKKGWSEGFGLY